MLYYQTLEVDATGVEKMGRREGKKLRREEGEKRRRLGLRLAFYVLSLMF